jgi:hypothetical protein
MSVTPRSLQAFRIAISFFFFVILFSFLLFAADHPPRCFF